MAAGAAPPKQASPQQNTGGQPANRDAFTRTQQANPCSDQIPDEDGDWGEITR